MKPSLPLIEKLCTAFERRSTLFLAGEPFRAFHRELDGQAGLWIDHFHSVVIIHIEDQYMSLVPTLRRSAEDVAQLFQVRMVYVRLHHRKRDNSREEDVFVLTKTENAGEEFQICEQDIRYLIRPRIQVNGGFFVDAKGLRALVRAQSRNARVLNTFAFTGSIGLAALAGGASEVTQIDISKGILRWAKENYELNPSLCGDQRMKFIVEDSRSYLAREERRIKAGKAAFDIVILDPPTFGNSGGKPFRLVSAYRDLIRQGAQVLREDGDLFFSCNCTQITLRELEVAVTDVATALSRKVMKLEAIT
ncbi:MAG: class I SAM-dependent methyltransferase, partial [Bdellovibrionota bacterium]